MQSPFSRAADERPGEPALSVYRYVLAAFPRLGRSPTLSEIQRGLNLSESTIREALRSLESADALRVDPVTSWIADAYPYSPKQTNHRVELHSGISLYCMCAIDCFYVPFLTGSDVVIASSCHVCGERVDIIIQGESLSLVSPPTVVVWDSDAPYDCPKTNFFCCDAHLEEWCVGHPDEPGEPCSIDAALERGRRAAVHIRQIIKTTGEALG